jgi:hypothetical protein
VSEEPEVQDWEEEDQAESLSRRERLKQWGHNVSARALSIEKRYLSLLRYSMLILASLLLVASTIYVVMGVVKQLGSSTVTPEPVQISAGDIAPQVSAPDGDIDKSVDTEVPFSLSAPLKKRTLAVYKGNFAKFEREDEKATDKTILDTVWPEERRNAFDGLDVNYVSDEGQTYGSGEDLALHAVTLVEKSAVTADFKQSLQSYRAAKKAQVCRNVSKTRKRTVSYWDSESMSCSNWYYVPYGCSSTRTVTEPYTEKVCEMQFPDDLASPATAMGQALERFLSVAEFRQTDAEYRAEEQSAEINERKVTGRGDLMDGGKIFLGFLGLMFLYLLVVIERHHRLLRQLVKPERDED